MNYYESEAYTYFQNTVDINVSAVLSPFTDLLPDRARVLDAGCGSGRDVRFFKQQGFRVDAFDASFALVALASDHSGVTVTRQRFQDFHYDHLFDGIWCCASLLHVPKAELNHIMARLREQLVPGGVLYVSFKHGDFEERLDGYRVFTDMNEVNLEIMFERLRMDVVRMWQTTDYRPDNDTQWLNAVARREL